MGKGHRRCEVCGIKEAWHTGTKLLFSKFPLDLNRCREWLKAVGNEELVHLPIEKLHEQRNVCANHFGKKDFNKKGTRLKRHAIPTLNLKALPLTDAQLAEFPQYMYKHSESKDADKVDINGPANPPALEVTDTTKIPVPNPAIPETETPSIAHDLDPEILSALGEQSDDTPEFGESIHETLAQRWHPILKKGLPKEAKDKLLKEYLVPSNCALLQAPKLNAEISAAITDMERNRDKKMELSQQLLGTGITAVNRAMTLLITGEEKIQAIKMLSDSCRILTHLHHMDTEARIKLVTGSHSLDRSFLNVIKDNERDSTLFGIKLSEKIKASKAIEKQGLIKNYHLSFKTLQTVQSSVTRPHYQENWPGPSRYLLNRGGGGGGDQRQAPAVRKPQTAAQPRYSNTNKTRAQPQQ